MAAISDSIYRNGIMKGVAAAACLCAVTAAIAIVMYFCNGVAAVWLENDVAVAASWRDGGGKKAASIEEISAAKLQQHQSSLSESGCILWHQTICCM